MGVNQIFRYTRCNTPKRVTSFAGPIFASLHPGNTASFKKCRSDGEPLVTLCTIWPARDRTSDLPLQRWTRYRSTNWTVLFTMYRLITIYRFFSFISN